MISGSRPTASSPFCTRSGSIQGILHSGRNVARCCSHVLRSIGALGRWLDVS